MLLPSYSKRLFTLNKLKAQPGAQDRRQRPTWATKVYKQTKKSICQNRIQRFSPDDFLGLRLSPAVVQKTFQPPPPPKKSVTSHRTTCVGACNQNNSHHHPIALFFSLSRLRSTEYFLTETYPIRSTAVSGAFLKRWYTCVCQPVPEARHGGRRTAAIPHTATASATTLSLASDFKEPPCLLMGHRDTIHLRFQRHPTVWGVQRKCLSSQHDIEGVITVLLLYFAQSDLHIYVLQFEHKYTYLCLCACGMFRLTGSSSLDGQKRSAQNLQLLLIVGDFDSPSSLPWAYSVFCRMNGSAKRRGCFVL